MSRTEQPHTGKARYKGKRSLRRNALSQVVKTWRKDLPVLRILQSFCASNPTPFSLGASLSSPAELINLRIDPMNYLDEIGEKILKVGRGPHAFSTDYQVSRMLCKYPFEGLTDTREAAKLAWSEAEEQCRLSNLRLTSQAFWASAGVFNEVFHLAKLLCYDILGEFSCEEWFEECRFGPGATAGESTRLVYDKLEGSLGSTPRAKPLVEALVTSSPCWSAVRNNRKIGIRDSGMQNYVPKNAKTDRSIEIQPGGNLILQLGIGSLIRQRLRSAGLNLNSQEKNQKLARRGSIDGSLATLDLKAASDTVCYRLVEQLLPPRWFHALALTRVDALTLADSDEVVRLEKFSSMGNGYTFELESLIFLVLCVATVRIFSKERLTRVSVFGDDLIVPTWSVSAIMDTFKLCGFQFNTDKSYWQGGFRESCGTDFFFGKAVEPFYIKKEGSDVQTQIRIANRIWRHALERGGGHYLDRRYFSAWRVVFSNLPPSIRKELCGPYSTDDRWLIRNDESGVLRSFLKVDRSGATHFYWVRCLNVSPKDRHEDVVSFDTAKAAMLYFCSRREQATSTAESPFSSVPDDIASGFFRVLHPKIRLRVKVCRTRVYTREPLETYSWF